MTFKPIDAKRDEFRKYLERTGVLEAITKVFMELLQIEPSERPENAIEFLYTNLGASKELSDTLERVKQELEDERNETARLRRALQNLEIDKQKKSDNEGDGSGDAKTTITASTKNDEQTDSKTNQQNKEIIDKSDDDSTDNAVNNATEESLSKTKIAGENNEKDSKSESTEKTETVAEEKN